MVHYKVMHFLDSYDTDTIATNKLCKLNFKCFYFVLSYKSAAGLPGLFFINGVLLRF